MADHNENLKDTLNEEIEHADQKPAEEHYSLNDDRRVKVLSPGMLVAKRFFRNRLAVTGMAILLFMFVFSFIGGLISPYEQDKFFYADKTIRREFAAVIKNTEFRYSSADDSVFGLPAQAQAMLAIQQQKDGFTYRDNRFTLTKEAEDFYSVSVNGQVVGLAYKSVVSPSASDATLSFEFTYQALKAYLTDGADTFTADGKTYTVENKAGVGFINAAQKGSLKIVKTSSDGKVEGFSFRVTGVDYDQTFKTDKNGEIVIEGLRIGDYTVSEVSDKASAGYILPADKQATVKVDATAIVQMHNEFRDTPKTGDDFNLGLWVSLAALSVVGAGVLGFVGYKNRKKKKED